MRTIAREAKPRVRERDIAIAVPFLHTGLRVSELTKLKLVNVDLDRDQVKIIRKGNKEQAEAIDRLEFGILKGALAGGRVSNCFNQPIG